MDIRDGFLDHDWEDGGVLRGEDPQLDLNSPRMRVDLPLGK